MLILWYRSISSDYYYPKILWSWRVGVKNKCVPKALERESPELWACEVNHGALAKISNIPSAWHKGWRPYANVGEACWHNARLSHMVCRANERECRLAADHASQLPPPLVYESISGGNCRCRIRPRPRGSTHQEDRECPAQSLGELGSGETAA